MEHLMEIYYSLCTDYTQWWINMIGPDGVDYLQRFSCAVFGGMMVFGFYEIRDMWKNRKLKKEMEEVK